MKIRPTVIRPATGGAVELSRYRDGSANLLVADADTSAVVRLTAEEALELIKGLFGVPAPRRKPTRRGEGAMKLFKRKPLQRLGTSQYGESCPVFNKGCIDEVHLFQGGELVASLFSPDEGVGRIGVWRPGGRTALASSPAKGVDHTHTRTHGKLRVSRGTTERLSPQPEPVLPHSPPPGEGL